MNEGPIFATQAFLLSTLIACSNGPAVGSGTDAAPSGFDSGNMTDGGADAPRDANPFDVDLDGPGCKGGVLTLMQATPPTWATQDCTDCVNGCVYACHSMCQSYYQCYCQCALTDPPCQNNCIIATSGFCRECALSSGTTYACSVSCETPCCAPSGLSCGLQNPCCKGFCDAGTCS